ncbi:hypothetical protein BD779DRAFT_1477331 [Infundibulicybe gibba]|nr:hypothetical protein BD779DRAFT_1477331 [Infundibulicybe gibba]
MNRAYYRSGLAHRHAHWPGLAHRDGLADWHGYTYRDGDAHWPGLADWPGPVASASVTAVDLAVLGHGVVIESYLDILCLGTGAGVHGVALFEDVPFLAVMGAMAMLMSLLDPTIGGLAIIRTGVLSDSSTLNDSEQT